MEYFEFEEDKVFFEELFSVLGGLNNNMHFFDFRDPKVKRDEFNKMRKKIFEELHFKMGNICQLECHPDCEKDGKVVDHFIPLSSNKLNKQLRHLKAEKGKKVKTQSFGSNNSENFVLACRRCNAFKQNGFPDKKLILKILSN